MGRAHYYRQAISSKARPLVNLADWVLVLLAGACRWRVSRKSWQRQSQRRSNILNKLPSSAASVLVRVWPLSILKLRHNGRWWRTDWRPATRMSSLAASSPLAGFVRSNFELNCGRLNYELRTRIVVVVVAAWPAGLNVAASAGAQSRRSAVIA